MTKGSDAAPETKTLRLEAKPNEARPVLIARAVNGPHLSSANTITAFGKDMFGPVGITEAVADLALAAKAVHAGDMTKAEAMLMSQASALNTLFAALAHRSRSNIGQGQYLDAADRYMRLALKAQSQCRATLETLATIKNPPPVFARQANFANGPQQINNGVAPPASRAPASEAGNRPNELLEESHGKRLDTGAAATPVDGNPELATVATRHGTTHD